MTYWWSKYSIRWNLANCPFQCFLTLRYKDDSQNMSNFMSLRLFHWQNDLGIALNSELNCLWYMIQTYMFVKIFVTKCALEYFAILRKLWFFFSIQYLNRFFYENKKEEIWPSPMTKAPTQTEMSKGQSDNTNNATKKFEKIINQCLGFIFGRRRNAVTWHRMICLVLDNIPIYTVMIR